MNYKIAAGNVVEITREGASKPFIKQPHWPNGTEWATKAEAEAWAQAFIANAADPYGAPRPGASPEEPTLPPREELPVEPVLEGEIIEEPAAE